MSRVFFGLILRLWRFVRVLSTLIVEFLVGSKCFGFRIGVYSCG